MYFISLQNDEFLLRTRGTIPYLGLFLNDLAMLNESASDWVDKSHKNAQQGQKSSSRPCSSIRSSPTESSSISDHLPSHLHSSPPTPPPRHHSRQASQTVLPKSVRTSRTLADSLPIANDFRRRAVSLLCFTIE